MMEMKLTLGPLLFNWPVERWSDFYFRIADEAAVERVCIGEVICSKRLPLFAECLPDMIERLVRGGKTVLLSSLALPTRERERRLADELLAIPGVMVEANDVSVLARLSGRRHAVGPFVNVYNEATLAYLTRNDAEHVCLPPELPLASIAALAAAATGASIEVWAFGRIPLAISARCYHARIHGLTRDSCQFVCGANPDGRAVETLDGEPFVAINGVQTLSYTYCNLLDEVDDLANAGVKSLRLSPHSGDMVAVAQVFRARLDGQSTAREATEWLSDIMPSARFSNGFLRGRPGRQWSSAGPDRTDTQLEPACEHAP